MSADTLGQIAIQVPALVLLSWVFSMVLKEVLNERGARMDKMADAQLKTAEALGQFTETVKEMARRCPQRNRK